jgi:hypothetical protein
VGRGKFLTFLVVFFFLGGKVSGRPVGTQWEPVGAGVPAKAWEVKKK